MIRKTFRSLSGIFSDVAQRKANAARARQSGADPAAEPSVDAYADSCAQVAAAFAADGYRYAKSGPHLTKKMGAFSYRISFQSSRHNIPGQHVSLAVAANVGSRELEAWRKSQPLARRRDDWLAGGLIHLLGTDLTYVTWDVADAALRPAVIADVAAFIRSVALPYFARFEEPAKLIAELEVADIPAVDIGDAVECALCFSGPESAKKILRRFAAERPNLAGAIRQAEKRIQEEGHTKYFPTAYADQVAFLRSAYSLTE